ncbi:MAG: cyclase family protein [Acidimicrobiia bacterium]|nr:cyclase family protein [Acidimicrobiia bacterium]
MPSDPSEQEVISWFDSLSNWGRWGPDDALGTLNLITAEVRRKAAATVTEGVSVSCGWDVPPGPIGYEGSVTAVDLSRESKARIGWSLEHITGLVFHGYATTHLDALCHIFWDGKMYNGRPTDLVSEEAGAQQLAITDAGGGMLTRGVLLDVARVREVPWLEPGEGAYPADLEAAEAAQGVRVEPGDAVLLRTGYGRWRHETGKVSPMEQGITQPGWQAACLPWLHERGASFIGCDTANDVSPSGYGTIALPVHVIGLVAMGLWLVDNWDLEELARTCERLSRWHFLLSVNPLRLTGLTGSAVNPIATF